MVDVPVDNSNVVPTKISLSMWKRLSSKAVAFKSVKNNIAIWGKKDKADVHETSDFGLSSKLSEAICANNKENDQPVFFVNGSMVF